MAQQRYSLGRLTQLDLDKAAFDYLDAQINLENNRYALMLKKLSIDHLLSINLL
jgi:outer membrane protein TolC